MNFHITSYTAYLVITISITIWVAHTLFKNGKTFLIDIFHKNEKLADSVNHLLIVGFYLINIGYTITSLKILGNIDSTQVLIEKLSIKIGFILLVLGGMHFLNLMIFFKLRNKAMKQSNALTEKIVVKQVPYKGN